MTLGPIPHHATIFSIYDAIFQGIFALCDMFVLRKPAKAGRDAHCSRAFFLAKVSAEK